VLKFLSHLVVSENQVFKNRNAAADRRIGQAEQIAYLLVGLMPLLPDQVKERFRNPPL